MGIYEMGLAMSQQNSNMNKYMNGNSGDKKSAFESFKETYNNRILSDFCDHVLHNVYSKYANEESERSLKKYFEDFEKDLVPIFWSINEECLNDPEFSKSISEGKEYTRLIGTSPSIDFIDPKTRIEREMLYVPSTSPDQPNIIRLVARRETDGTPYPHYAVVTEICDDGTIKAMPPRKMKSEDEGEVVNIEDTGIEVKDEIFGTQEVLMTLFEKVGIKEAEDDNTKTY